VSRTLAFESYLLLLEVFEIDIFKFFRQLALYTMIDRLETEIQ
jgi:hypothetical protein